jgi:hypothetical protein
VANYLNEAEIYDAYTEADKEAIIWRIDYPQYERLADNGLLEDLDDSLPEVNDGTLAASLFKLAKRVIREKIGGRAFVADEDEDWITELANIEFRYIMKNAHSKATPRRKLKDAARKAAIFGGQPIINMQVERGNYCGQDFIVPYAQDVKLQAGKDSDQDSDIIFWDFWLDINQVKDMRDQANDEIKGKIATEVKDTDPLPTEGDNTPAKTKDADHDGDDDSDPDDNPDAAEDVFNEWNLNLLDQIIAADEETERKGNEMPRDQQEKGVRKAGIHFYIAWQRGVNAPFKLMYKSKAVQSWSNPDPTGDIPCHYVYCYQDFVNPYGIGIVKLAGGTQNVLDYMRQADVLATQLGLRPPKQIMGDEDQVDEDSLVYAQDANWYVGQAKVERMELGNAVYSELPNRMAMYKTSLNQLIPTGDTSIGSGAGDPNYSKTPKGVAFQQQNLSIDDQDFSENIDEAWAAVARSMINNQFANMQGEDWRRITDDEKQDLLTAGIPQDFFEAGTDGQPSNKVKMVWDKLRRTFDFEVDPTTGYELTAEEEIQVIRETLQTMTPQVAYYLAQAGWKIDIGEVYYSLLAKMNLENLQKILRKMNDQERQQASQMPFPIIDPPQVRLMGKVPTAAMPYAMQAGGVTIPPGTPLEDDMLDMGDILADPNTTPGEKAQIKAMAGIQPDPNGLNQPSQADIQAAQVAGKQGAPDASSQVTPEQALKAQQQSHQQALDEAHLQLDAKKLQLEAQRQSHELTAMPSDLQSANAQQKGIASTQNARMPSFAPDPGHVQQVQQLYGVDAPTAAAALTAEHMGGDPQAIIQELQRQSAPVGK